MGLSIFLVPFVLYSGVTHAAVIHCESRDKDDFVGIKALSYDTTKRTASVSMGSETYQGRISLIRAHGSVGDKVNILFPSPFSFHDSSARMEVIAFPITKSEYRAVGTITVEIDGERHMDVSIPNVVMDCRDLAL
ncbi:MAG: hypothetical protein ABS92_09090 [Thiobacillus sp. SCN 63-374]|nr:MAG: hypothetical protein ABS92_09090 [Thiobacillus sp. SCN 63-374]